jgi:co-chaperonin GroES (HSP10)
MKTQQPTAPSAEPPPFIPIQDKVLVRRLEGEEVTISGHSSVSVESSASGLLIPFNIGIIPCRGTVVSVGSKCETLKPGDRVLFKSEEELPPLMTLGHRGEWMVYKEKMLLGALEKVERPPVAP